jgi:guanylate kinase
VASVLVSERRCLPLVTDPFIVVISGPGGVGKGTIVDALLERDPSLWLSRSWTTRERRPGERETAYVFTDRESFEKRIAADGFLEYTDFLGNYYGTPTPEAPNDAPVILEIEVDGAIQVRKRYPQAVLIFIMPPSRDEQRRRLQGRGDPEHKVAARLKKAEEEEPVGREISNHVVVNDELDRTVDELLAIIRDEQSRRS